MIKAVLFDFDGVLTTDATGTTSIVNFIRNKTSLDAYRFERAYRKHNKHLLYGQKTHEDVWKEICQEVACDIDQSVLKSSFIDTPLDRNMFELVYRLKSNGYQVGMITDNKTDRIQEILAYHQLEDLFDVVMISADVKSGKKELEIFKRTLQTLKVANEECVFIDNNMENLKIPDEIGMKTFYFDHHLRNHQELKKMLKYHRVMI